MSWILGLDTTSAELGIGLMREDRPVAAYSRYLRGSHAEHIARGVTFMLQEAHVSAAELSYAGVAVGPGSFTGLRIGIAFVKGLLVAGATKVTAVSSLESIARSWRPVEPPIAVALDARNGQIFAAVFQWREGSLRRLTDDALISAGEFYDTLSPDARLLTDTLGYERCTAFAAVADRPNTFALEEYPLQRGLACARIARDRREQENQWIAPSALLPRYMQLSAAERRSNAHTDT